MAILLAGAARGAQHRIWRPLGWPWSCLGRVHPFRIHLTHLATALPAAAHVTVTDAPIFVVTLKLMTWRSTIFAPQALARKPGKVPRKHESRDLEHLESRTPGPGPGAPRTGLNPENNNSVHRTRPDVKAGRYFMSAQNS